MSHSIQKRSCWLSCETDTIFITVDQQQDGVLLISLYLSPGSLQLKNASATDCQPAMHYCNYLFFLFLLLYYSPEYEYTIQPVTDIQALDMAFMIVSKYTTLRQSKVSENVAIRCHFRDCKMLLVISVTISRIIYRKSIFRKIALQLSIKGYYSFDA